MPHSWLKHKNWAVVGASPNPSRYSNKIIHALKDNGYHPLLVSPKYDEIDGIKTYAQLSAIDQAIDVVNMVVNPSIGIHILDQCAQLGIKKIWLQPGSSSPALIQKAKDLNLDIIEACILVVLAW